jgi:hypothetical protein
MALRRNELFRRPVSNGIREHISESTSVKFSKLFELFAMDSGGTHDCRGGSQLPRARTGPFSRDALSPSRRLYEPERLSVPLTSQSIREFLQPSANFILIV